MSSESGGLPVSAETIAILGAGAMGSALTTPLLRAGHRVHLWGTERDDHLLAAIRDGEPHPRLGVVIDRATRLFPSAKLAQALDGVALVVLAISLSAKDGAAMLVGLGISIAAMAWVAVVTRGFIRAAEWGFTALH